MRGLAAGVLFAVAMSGCGGAAADHDRLGDRHYREGRYGLALAEYRAAQRTTPRPEVWAKAGVAALRAGDAMAAVEAFERLGTEDPARVAEAARGLERAARLGMLAGQPGSPAVAAAVMAIRRLTPDRPLGRLAVSSGWGDGGRRDATRMLPAAIAAAGGHESVDRLLMEYADGLRATTACESAVKIYRTALRRVGTAALRREARDGLAACALQLGLDAMAAERLDAAEQWLAEAAAADSTGPAGVQARIAWGAARLSQGDVLGAAIAWQAVASMPAAPDSLRQVATARLNSLGHAGPPDGGKDTVP